MRNLITSILLGIAAGMSLVTPAKSQSNQQKTILSQLSARIAPPVPGSKQIADQLIAKTQPDYYTALFVTSHQSKRLPSASARLATLCGGSCPVSSAGPIKMPVKLIDFSGQRLDTTQVQLSWTTSAEINNDRFAIERSANPANGFEAIGSVKGKGPSEQNTTYQFIDPNTSTDYTYYRLKQIDLDGSYSYSQIIAIKGVLSVLSVMVFPNPGEARQINFRISGVGPTDGLSIVLYDAQGRTLHQQQNAVLDADRQLSIPVSLSLPPGRYYVKVTAKNQQAGSPFVVHP